MTDTYEGIPQRDATTRAIVTRIPGGVVTPGDLETIARTARKFRVPFLKLTSGQRVLLAGIAHDSISEIGRAHV